MTKGKSQLTISGASIDWSRLWTAERRHAQRISGSYINLPWVIPYRVGIEGDAVRPLYEPGSDPEDFKWRFYIPLGTPALIPALVGLDRTAPLREPERLKAVTRFVLEFGQPRVHLFEPNRVGSVAELFTLAKRVSSAVESIQAEKWEQATEEILRVLVGTKGGDSPTVLVSPAGFGFSGLETSIYATNLFAVAGLLLADMGREGTQITKCEDCGQPFQATRKGQRFCPPVGLMESETTLENVRQGAMPPAKFRSLCQDRSRQRRYRVRKKEEEMEVLRAANKVD